MVKKTTQQRKRKQPKRQQGANFASELSLASKRYAALLADPCNGPLVQSPFGAGSGGLVSRFESDFLVGWSATSTNTAVAFAPAIPMVYGEGAALTSDTAAINWATTTASPGRAYLLSNARSFRCLSACIQVYWPGSELNRSGIISLGQAGAQEALSTVLTVSQLRSSSQYVERMPERMSEIIWRPTDAEVAWNTPNDTTDMDRFSALYVTASGIPVSTGIRVRVVAVYEWIPRPDLAGGMVLPTAKVGTSDTLGGIVSALDKFGDWMYHGAGATAKAVSSLVAGGTAVGRVANGTYRVARALLT